MKKILLTSAGFDNPNIRDKALDLLKSITNKTKVLFVVTAAVTEGQKKVLPLCKAEILGLGIKDSNIITYDFESYITEDEISQYHMIYVAGGHTQTLLDRFDLNKLPLDKFFTSGGLYLGVSAGSLIMTNAYEKSLNYLNFKLRVHQEIGSTELDESEVIDLTDNQAILIRDDLIELIE